MRLDDHGESPAVHAAFLTLTHYAFLQTEWRLRALCFIKFTYDLFAHYSYFAATANNTSQFIYPSFMFGRMTFAVKNQSFRQSATDPTVKDKINKKS